MQKKIRHYFEKLFVFLKKNQARPLRTHHHDVKLLQKAHGKRCPNINQFTRLNKFLSKKEKIALRLSALVLLIGIAWISLEFISNNRIQVPEKGGKFVEAVVGSPQFINPVFASTNDVDMDITELVFSGLMRYDDEHRLVPDLAAKYEVSEDKKVYTFELRKDVIWHDEEPFTARDVLFTFETIQNSLVGSPLQVTFQGVSVEMPDEYTIRFVLSEPFAPFLSTLTVGIIPEHLWFETPPEQMRLSSLNLQPIGTGSFVFKKLSKNDSGHIYSYELERFDRYFRQPAFLNEFVFQFFADYEGHGGAIDAFREKKVTALNFVPQALRDKVERKYTILHILELPQYTALFFNQDHNSVLKDKNIRLAIAKSIDKNRILNEVLNNEGYIINGPLLPNSPGYDEELEPIRQSYEEANQLLDKDWERIDSDAYRENLKQKYLKEWEEKQEQLGTTSSTESEIEDVESFVEEVSTSTARELAEKEIDERLNQELQEAQLFYRQNEDEKILQLTITTAQTVEYQKAAELIAGFLQNIGVKANIEYVESRDFSRKVLRGRDYDILLYGEIVGNDPDPYPFWHSSQIDYPGLNLSKYVNRSVDEMIEKARESVDDNEVVELYKKFQSQLLADLPAIFLYMPTYTYATTNEVQGIDVVRISHPSDRFADVTTWYIKTKGEWNF